MANKTFFPNITFDIKCERSSDEDEIEERKPVSLDTPIMETYSTNQYRPKEKQARQLTDGLSVSVASLGSISISGAKINKIQCMAMLCLKWKLIHFLFIKLLYKGKATLAVMLF